MSSESEGEEFFDACDITPTRVTRVGETINKAVQQSNTSSFIASSANLEDDKNVIREKNELSTSSHIASSLKIPHTMKLASSLPTLHIQEEEENKKNDTFKKPITKEEFLIPSITSHKVRIPSSIPLDNIKCDKEESSSACSGSLLSNLGNDDDESRPQSRGRGRRNRPKNRRPTLLDDDDDALHLPSPTESPSSSVDAVYPDANTAPFRVVEHDSTSVYSTTYSYSQDKGSKVGISSLESKEKISDEVSTAEKPEEVKAISSSSLAEAAAAKDDASLLPSSEPDVVASTKSNSLPRAEVVSPVSFPDDSARLCETQKVLLENIPKKISPLPVISFPTSKKMPAPVAPPRKKNRRKKRNDDDTVSLSSISSLPVPVLSMAIKNGDDISHTLDLNEATQGDYIVKIMDSERRRGARSEKVDLPLAESAGDETSQASTPETSRTFSQLLNPPTENLIKLDEPKKIKPKEALLVGDQANPPADPGGGAGSNSKCQLELGTPSSPNEPKVQSDSGKELTDQEILSQVNVLNLDTGESIPLSEADERLPTALNPLSLHIMKLTKEYTSLGMDREDDSDEGSIAEIGIPKLPEIDSALVKKKTSQLKKLIGKTMGSAVNKARNLAQEVSSKGRDEKDVFENDTPAQNTMQFVKIKTAHSHKGPIEFDNLMYVQELKGDHTGPVWCMRFSPCGRLLATAGQDHTLRVWVLKQAFHYFLDIRTKWNADVKSSPTPSQESLVSQHSSHSSEDIGTLDPSDDGVAPFMPKPFCLYTGHTADVLDLSWSKNYFILTSSMDKTVRLWHISRKECLCIFKHVDFVTASAFHPKDDRYFISGSLDGKLRLWSIPDKQVVLWNEVEGHPKLITAANFCQNGAFTVIGTYNGRCIFYRTSELKYYTQIHVKSSRGKNSHGKKITGIEPLPDEDKLMITSNDSRIRLYDLNVLNVSCKYKGYSNISSQIRAGFSHDGKYIVAGSENQCIYIWKTHHDYSKFSSARKDRNVYWEGVKAHSAVVTCAIFSPHPEHVFNFIEDQKKASIQSSKKDDEDKLEDKDVTNNPNKGYVLVSADFNGCIKVFLKREKPKHSSLPASALS